MAQSLILNISLLANQVRLRGRLAGHQGTVRPFVAWTLYGAHPADATEHLRASGAFRRAARRFRDSEALGIRSFDLIPPAIDAVSSAPLGITMRYPLVDPRLLETVLAIRWEFKVSDKLDRMLIRGAAGPFLPDMIAQRPGKSYVSPDFEDRLRAAEPELRSILCGNAHDRRFERLVDLAKAQSALELLEAPDSQERDLRLIRHVVLPGRLAQFMAGSRHMLAPAEPSQPG